MPEIRQQAVHVFIAAPVGSLPGNRPEHIGIRKAVSNHPALYPLPQILVFCNEQSRLQPRHIEALDGGAGRNHLIFFLRNPSQGDEVFVEYKIRMDLVTEDHYPPHFLQIARIFSNSS